MDKYFPQGIVTDYAFCNRETERAAIKASIASHEHLVLIAPRRYGKSSLIAQVLKENPFPGLCIDLFFVLTQAEVVKTMIVGISQLLETLLPKTKLVGKKLMDFVFSLNPKLMINLLGQKIEINVRQADEQTIADLLMLLDSIAKQVNKPCVVVFDEFQQVGELKENHAIEAMIRHAVERSQMVSYIFCGSKRHLLNEMFSSRSRPLYHSCDLMVINRIENEAYQKFINKMAKSKWGQLLDTDVISAILSLTENHPYYVNVLCRQLWHNHKAPLLSDVRTSWHHYVMQQVDWMVNDLDRLTLNRRKVLTAIAHQPTNEPQGHAFSMQVGLSPSTIKKTFADLHQLDLVYRDERDYYHVLDPALAYFLRASLSAT